MKFTQPSATELARLRRDPLLWEQELDVRPQAAEALEQALGFRAGAAYWRSAHDHLYAIELADLGRGRPSMAMVYGFWERFEPRPPEHEIDRDLYDLALWAAGVMPGIDPADVARVSSRAGLPQGWPDGSVIRAGGAQMEPLPDYPYPPRQVEIEGLRMAWVESGSGDPILMLHGEPTWGYLYRHMIEPLLSHGRVILPDLIGFGRSDKPIPTNAYTLRSHLRWITRFIESLDLSRITLVCQDWGGLLGLRVVAAMPQRFARIVAMNTGLPCGEAPGEAFLRWRTFSQRIDVMDPARVVDKALVRRRLTDAQAAAYRLPFPDRASLTGAHVFPRLVPTRPDHPGAAGNESARAVLASLQVPVLLLHGAEDAITAPWMARLAQVFPQAGGVRTVARCGHFLQEDAGEEVAGMIAEWLRGGV